MRAAILAGARRLFIANGFERTSMDAVAAVVRVSKMTIYRHFRSKEELFAGTVTQMCDAIADPELPQIMMQLPLRQALEAFARRSLETIFDPETLGLHRIVVGESRQFPELGRIFYERGPGTNIAMLAAYLAQVGGAAVPSKEAERLASGFMSLLRGYEHMRALLGVDEPPNRRTRDAQIARAVEYVLAKVK